MFKQQIDTDKNKESFIDAPIQFQIHPALLPLGNHSNVGSVRFSIACRFSAPHSLFAECLGCGSFLSSFACVASACERPPCQPCALLDPAARRTVEQTPYIFITRRASHIVGSCGFEPLAAMVRTTLVHAWVTYLRRT